jgi:hypothetical protein
MIIDLSSCAFTYFPATHPFLTEPGRILPDRSFQMHIQ